MNKTFSESYIITLIELILDYIVLNNYLLDTTCFTYAEDNFIRITSLHNRRLTAPNITAQLNLCYEKKNVNIHCEGETECEVDLYGRIAVKKPLLRKQNNVKRLQLAKVYKHWTIEQWNKVIWTDESKFEFCGSNRRVNVWWSVGEKASNFSITPTIKYGGGSVMVLESFTNCKVRDLHQVMDKLSQTSNHCKLRLHTVPSRTWLVGQGFVLMQDNDPKYTHKLC